MGSQFCSSNPTIFKKFVNWWKTKTIKKEAGNGPCVKMKPILNAAKAR